MENLAWKLAGKALILLIGSALGAAALADEPLFERDAAPGRESAAPAPPVVGRSLNTTTTAKGESEPIRKASFLSWFPGDACSPCTPSAPCGECGPDGGYTFHWGADKWCNIGPQIRTSFNSVTINEPKGGNYFAIDNARLFFTGKVHQYIGFELSTDLAGAGGQDFVDASRVGFGDSIHLLDADVRFEFNDYVNIWAGRFRPPSDRTNLSGPFFINTWDLPFVSKYPNIYLGRDDGVAYWGQYGGGQVKWQFGLFNGTGRFGAGNDWPVNPAGVNRDGNVEYAMRVVVNLLDPEPGYYNYSTYYGQKDILAIGFALQNQTEAVTDAAHRVGTFTGWNVDFLYENKLTEWGSVTLEGAYYDYSVDSGVISAVAGESGFVYAGWLLPRELGCCGLCGRFRPFVRYQKYDYDNTTAAATAKAFREGWDAGVEYVIKGHNARFTTFWGDRDIVGNGRENIFRTGLQIVF